MAYPLSNIEIVNLCSRIRRGRNVPKYPDMYYDLRKEYHATKDNNGLRYSYKYVRIDNNNDDNDVNDQQIRPVQIVGINDNDNQRVKAIQAIGHNDRGYVIEHNETHTLFVIHFGTRYPSTEEIRINNNLAMKGIRPFIYETGMVVNNSYYAPNVARRTEFNTKKNHQTKNELGKPVWYWITDYFTYDYLLDTVCKNGSNIEAAYSMFATLLPALHNNNFVITKFEMKQMFYGACSNYKDDTKTLMCVCPFRRWFFYPDEKISRGKEYLPPPYDNQKIMYIKNIIVKTDFSRYNSVRTDESELVEPIDNWMSVMFIMLDVMGTFIPDCIIYDNDYKGSRFFKKDFNITKEIIDRTMSYKEALRQFALTYNGTEDMYKYMLNKYLYNNRAPIQKYIYVDKEVNDEDIVDRDVERNIERKINLIKRWKKNFVQYINWMLLNYNNDISVEYIKNNIDTIVYALSSNNNVFNVDGVQWSFFNLFVTCIGYISMIRQFKRNYIDTEFMTRTVPEFLHILTIIYTCWVTYTDESYKQSLQELNPNVNIPYTTLQDYTDFFVDTDILYTPVIFNIDSVKERASYQRFVDYTCMNDYKYPVVRTSPRLEEIMNNVTGVSIPDYTFEEENRNDYLRRMNTLSARLIENRNLNVDPRYYNGQDFVETAYRNMNTFDF